MAASKGNKHWLLRVDLSEDGRKLSLEDLKAKAKEYIEYCINNPILDKDFKGKDNETVYYEKPRAMTIEGLCVWLNIGTSTWFDWKKDKKYSDITTRVEEIMFSYDIEEAAANRLNSNIIARKLGLAEKTETKDTTDLSKEDRDKRIAELKKKMDGDK